MPQLSNVPKQQTYLRLAKAKSFALGLWFHTKDQRTAFGTPALTTPVDGIDITSDTVRMVIYEKPRFGSTVVYDQVATLVDPDNGYARVDLQTADTDLPARTYDFTITWVAENYVGAVVQGELEIVANGVVDPLLPDYDLPAPQTLGIELDERNHIHVVVDFMRAPDLQIGSVTTVAAGDPAAANFTGRYPRQLLNLWLPGGEQGPPAELSIGDITIGDNPNDADVTLEEIGPGAYEIDFRLPGPPNLSQFGGKVYLDAFPEITGDGVTNDIVKIQEVLDSLAAFGGGTVEGGLKSYGIEGELQIPNGVWLEGLGREATVFKLLDNTSRIRVGVWGDGDRPGGLLKIGVDGGTTGGHADGAVHFQSVMAQMFFCTIRDVAGDGLFLDAAQNANVIGNFVVNCGGSALAIANGAGGYNFMGSHFTSSAKCLKIYDDDSSLNNAYPFGSAHINFFGGVFEQYANGESVGELRALGGGVKFWGTGFSVNGAITMSDGYCLEISNADFPAIASYVEFDGCNFNGGDNVYDLVRVTGNQFVLFTGENYIQQSAKPIHVTAGSPRIRMHGDFLKGENITEPLIQASGAGSLVSVYNDHIVGENYKMPDDRITVFSMSRRTDVGHRFWMTRDGLMNWNDGAGFGTKQSIQWDSATDSLVLSSSYVAGRFGLYPGAFVFANGAVTIDCKVRSAYRYVLTGTGQISAMTVNNPVDGALLSIGVFDVTTVHTLTWPASFQWADNRKPEQIPNTWLFVTMMYDATNSVWLELARVEGMPATGGDGSGASPRRNVFKADTTTAYQPVLGDRGKWVTLTNAGAITLTIPANATVAFPVGTEIDFSAMGAGQVTIAPAGGVTLNSRGARLKSNGQYSVFSIKKTATDTWLVYGDLTT